MPQPPSWIVYSGLVLGVLGFLLSLRNIVVDRAKLRLSIDWDQDSGSFYDNEPRVRVTLRNVGRRPVCVESVTLLPTRPGQPVFEVEGASGLVLAEGTGPQSLIIRQAEVYSFCDGRWWLVRAEATTTTGRRRRSPSSRVAPHGRRNAVEGTIFVGGSQHPAIPGYKTVLHPNWPRRVAIALERLWDQWWPI